jgi:hypothetical protein
MEILRVNGLPQLLIRTSQYMHVESNNDKVSKEVKQKHEVAKV